MFIIIDDDDIDMPLLSIDARRAARLLLHIDYYSVRRALPPRATTHAFQRAEVRAVTSPIDIIICRRQPATRARRATAYMQPHYITIFY